MNGQIRADIKPGLEVEVVLKEDQPSGKLTRGIVTEILTSSDFHPRGIKVRLEDGQVGRVQNIIPIARENIKEQIRSTAESFRETIGRLGVKLEYDRESVFTLDEIIDRVLSSDQPPDIDQTVPFFASFFGEALIATLGGKWIKNKNGNLAVELQAANGDRVEANIISKVDKRFRNGMEDSLTYYYQMLEKLLISQDFLTNTRK